VWTSSEDPLLRTLGEIVALFTPALQSLPREPPAGTPVLTPTFGPDGLVASHVPYSLFSL